MYYLYTLLTAPGVVVHELAHAFFCWLAKVKIHKIKLFQFDKNIAGYVTHDEPSWFYQALLISFGPLLINSLFTLVLFSQVTQPSLAWINGLKTGANLSLVWIWLAIAVGLHSIPSTGDAKSLWLTATERWWHNPLKIIGLPFVLILYVLNWLRRLHIDVIYVIALFWLGNIFLKK